ncbi:tRNA 2-selenouridine synthase, partial [Candidatus Woesearchaeota archaeon]|nr:tRNA 2-selenouridine synthase [Candidatus Woesearchaeota archaeon]
MDKISVKDALEGNFIFIDTRTPDEYEECHVPGAFNVAILSNEERHIVGCMY